MDAGKRYFEGGKFKIFVVIDIPMICWLAGIFFVIFLLTQATVELSVGVISAIAGAFSAIAAFMSWLASNRAADAAEKSNVIASLPDRIKTCCALSFIWNYLNKKSCVFLYSPENPDHFLVTEKEIEEIRSLRETMHYRSASYGELFQKEVSEFYTWMSSNLEGQRSACDWTQEEQYTLLRTTQEKYHSLRKTDRDKAFALLEKATKLMHR